MIELTSTWAGHRAGSPLYDLEEAAPPGAVRVDARRRQQLLDDGLARVPAAEEAEADTDPDTEAPPRRRRRRGGDA